MKHMGVIGEWDVHLRNTYERRARGLVKKGRVYYVTVSYIYLFTPPENTEEKTLETNNREDISTRIDTILQQKEYLQEAFSAIEKISHDLSEELTATQMKTILEIVEAREKTNKEVVTLLHAMLDQDVISQGEQKRIVEKTGENIPQSFSVDKNRA